MNPGDAQQDQEWNRSSIFGWRMFCVECEIEPLLVTDETDFCANCRAGHPEILLENSCSA